MFFTSEPIRQVDNNKDAKMTINSRAMQDRRKASRVIARLDCSFTLEGNRHEAVIVDLSMKGALLSSKFLPTAGSTITIELSPPAVKKMLCIDCTVLRGTWVMADQGKRSRFSIRLEGVGPELLLLVSKFSS
jgi:hypothetical protein